MDLMRHLRRLVAAGACISSNWPVWLSLDGLIDRWVAISPADLIALGFDRGFHQVSNNEVLVLRQALADSAAIKLESFLGQETIAGGKTNKYRLVFDQAASGQARQVLTDTLGVDPKFVDQLDLILADVTNDLSGEIWLGVDDNLPRQVVLTSNVSGVQFDQGAVGKKSFNLIINFGDYNQLPEIARPVGAVSLMSVFGDQSMVATTTVR